MPHPTAETTLSWTIHPAAQRPIEAVAVGALVLLVLPLVIALTGSPGLALLATALLALSLRAYFLPCTFRLDNDGAHAAGPLQARRRLAWEAVRRVVRERHGVHLSTIHSRSRLVRDRGLFLRTAGNRDAVGAFVERRVGAA